MNWKSECQLREKKVNALCKEIKRIEREIKKVGCTKPIEIIRESMASEYNMPVRIRNDVGKHWKRLVIFSPDSTKKQLQYGRPEKELGSLMIHDSGVSLIMYDGQNVPETTEEIYNLMIAKQIGTDKT